MKIAVISMYSGVISRGIESWVQDMGNGLSQNNEIMVFQLGGPNRNERYMVKQVEMDIDWNKFEQSGEIFGISKKIYLSKILREYVEKCSPAIKDFHPDIIIPCNGASQTKAAKVLAKKIHSKIVCIGHFYDLLSMLYRPDLYISPNPFYAKAAKLLLVNCKLIPHGVDLSKFSLEGNKYEHSLKHPVVLCVGALGEWKNPDKAIKAIAKTKNLSLLMAGSGDLKYVEMGKELLGERFAYTKAKYSEMPSIYRSADIFTSPSKKLREAFGLVNVEALASNLPVVTTNDSTRKFIVENAGIFINPNNIDEYAKALENAVNIDWKDKPRKQAEKFDLEKIVEKYEEAFKGVI